MLKPGIRRTLSTLLCQCRTRGNIVEAEDITRTLADEGYRVYRKDEVDVMFKALKNIAGYPTYEPAAQELQRIASAALSKGTN